MAVLTFRAISDIYTNKSAILGRLYYGLNQYGNLTTYRGIENGTLEIYTNALTTSIDPTENNEGTTVQEAVDINTEVISEKLSSVVGGTNISIDDTDPINPIINFTGIPAGVVTNVTATSPITSSGGVTPNISTSMATNKLIGRATAATGVMEQITLGTNLAFSGTTLNVTNAALTKTDDTNVTLTLGGAPTTSLLSATSLTLGWAGQLSISRGGTGQTTANAALNALLPSQTTHAGKTLQTDGTNTSWVADGGGTVTSVAWTTSQGVSASIATSTTTPNITISLGVLTGVTSLNGLVVTADTGVITTGTWNGSLVTGTYGGTGVNNGSSTITLGGSLVTSGANSLTLTTTGATNVTLPTTGTLVTLAGSEVLTNKTLTSPTLTTPVLGTPSSGTLTNCTGLPTSGITGYQGYTIILQSNLFSPADATTYYMGIPTADNTVDGVSDLVIPKTGTIKRADAIMNNAGVLGSSTASTMSIRINDTTDTTLSASVATNSAWADFSNTGLALSVTAGDKISIKWVTPTWATNPTNVRFFVIIYIE